MAKSLTSIGRSHGARYIQQNNLVDTSGWNRWKPQLMLVVIKDWNLQILTLLNDTTILKCAVFNVKWWYYLQLPNLGASCGPADRTGIATGRLRSHLQSRTLSLTGRPLLLRRGPIMLTLWAILFLTWCVSWPSPLCIEDDQTGPS